MMLLRMRRRMRSSGQKKRGPGGAMGLQQEWRLREQVEEGEEVQRG